MPIAVTCQCGQEFQANDQLAGKQVKCPKCAQPLAIPAASGTAGEETVSADDISLDDLDALAAGAPAVGGDGAASERPAAGFQPAGLSAGSPAQGQPGGFQAGGFQPTGFQQAAFQQSGAQAPAAGASKKGKSSSSGFKIALICVGVAAVLAVGAIVLMKVLGDDEKDDQAASNGGNDPAPASSGPAQPAASAPAADKSLKLAVISPVAIDPGGRQTIELEVDRNGREGLIQVVVTSDDQVPQGVYAQPAPIPGGSSKGQIILAADAKLGEEELKVPLKVTVTIGKDTASQPLELTVKKLSLPSIQPVANVLLQPGGTASITLSVERNGFDGPIPVQLQGLPAGVTAQTAPVEEGADATTVDFTAAENAADAKQSVRAVAAVLGRTVQIEFPLQVASEPYRVDSLRVVWLKPGEQASLKLPVVRRSYQGPIEVSLANLPQGVTAPSVKVAEKQTEVTISLSAANDAEGQVRTAFVVSSAGALSRQDPIVVRINTELGDLLQEELTKDPDLPVLLRKGGFIGRLSTENKQLLLDLYGGTEESEAAVLRGLKWLAEHQQRDGNWPLKWYNHNIQGCTCRTQFESEVRDSNTAGTAFGVLPFLSVGIGPDRAPKDPPELAEYQRNVSRGVRFLMRQQDTSSDTKKMGKLDDNMYAHALGTMALCEAYGLSGEDRYKRPAQLAVRYLVQAQHSAGGWRYSANQAGDMSATGWVFLAIRSGQLSGVPVFGSALSRSRRFVNSCAAGPAESKRSQYSYTPDAAAKLSMSAAGLLTQQYLGWPKDNKDQAAGADYLMKHKPPTSGDKLGHIYYYYYATQVLHHLGGEDFDMWNYFMREHLIRTQQKTGHETGSWSPEGTNWGKHGGRLYSTSLAMMSLQVYYRHLPMYQHEVAPAEAADADDK